MAINFPNSPSDGDKTTVGGVSYTYSSSKNTWTPSTISSFDSDQVVTIVNENSKTTTVVASMTALIALTGMKDGDQALISGGDSDSLHNLYMYLGSGWYKIATIQNNSPSAITGVSGTYTLNTDGTPTIITAVSTDPEGFPLTFTHTTSGLKNIATITDSDNVFTITPSTDDSDNGTFTMTISATDGVNGAVSASTSITLNISVVVNNSKYTNALITATAASDNNNLTDASSNNATITTYGDTNATSFSPHRPGGYSYYGSANAHHLYATVGAIGTNEFTIECWVYFTTVGGPEGIFEINTQVAPTSQTNTISVFTRSSTYSYNWAFATNGSQVNGSTNPDENTWHHVALVRNSSNLITLYIDGTSIGTRTDSTNITANVLTIGRYYNTTYSTTGYIHDLRIVNGTAVYTSNFTPPTQKLEAITNTDLLTCRLGNIRDESTNNRTITVPYDGNDGSPQTAAFSPYDNETYVAADYGGSIKMSNAQSDTTHYFTIPDGDWKTYGTDDFTIEFWFRPGSDMSSRQFMFADFNSGGQNSSSSIVLYYQGATLKSWIETSTASGQSINGSTGARAHIWHHAALVRNGTTITLYLNGVSEGTYSVGSSSINNSSEDMYIGKYQGGEAYTGLISDIRVVKGTAVYTSAFTPPTAPLSTISGTSLHVKGIEASIVDKAQRNVLILKGNTTGSTTQVKFVGTNSMYFDGSSSYANIVSDDQLIKSMDFGTLDYTVEFWMYPTLSGNCFAFGFSDSSGTDSSVAFALRINYSASNLTVRFQNCNDAGTLNLSLEHTGNYNNTWSHVAVTRTGGNQYMYINGSQVDTQSDASAHMRTPSTSFSVGRAGDRATFYYKGYLQDLRITKGLARYTSTFTPPSSSLQG